MKTLIEKWTPLLEYKFKDGLSVPEDKYQECAERLEKFETRYKNKPKVLEGILPFCIKAIACVILSISPGDSLYLILPSDII